MAEAQDLYRLLGERIRTEREKWEFSQEKLAEKTDLNRNYIGEIERAEKKVTLETLWKIAKALDIGLEDLVRGLK